MDFVNDVCSSIFSQERTKAQDTPNELMRPYIARLIGTTTDFVNRVQTDANLEVLNIDFRDASFAFHAQWLHDAYVETRPSKDSDEVLSRKAARARIQYASLSGTGTQSAIQITSVDGSKSSFPTIWLRVMAPLVAKRRDIGAETSEVNPNGWLAHELAIPEVLYGDLFPQNSVPGDLNAVKERILDAVLLESVLGIVKVVGLPDPDVESERKRENTIVTKVLKELCGSVYFHPRRGADKSFNVTSSYADDMKPGEALPNYNTKKVLLPHTDHSHYTHPARIQGLYALEGESENVFVSCFATLGTLKKETPHLYTPFCKSPMSYRESCALLQAVIVPSNDGYCSYHAPGYPDKIKRFKWHPHLTGSLQSSYDDLKEARAAHRTFQEIMSRDTHLFRLVMKPGDLFIWDNFRILHGRNRVLEVPRTVVGQTVPEQVVVDQYRAVKMAKLRGFIEDK
jgi:trimethyllysine dioxygenase